MPTSRASHPVGTEVVYRHEGKARKAQVTSHHPETGEVNGLAVYEGSKEAGWCIAFGVPDPKHADTPQLEITDGHFHKQP